MGESKKDGLRVNFDKKLKLEFHGVKVTSDEGLLVFREIDDTFGLMEMTTCEPSDNRTGKNTQHSIGALLRQSVYNDFQRTRFYANELFESLIMHNRHELM
jgi:hypothetical protein